MMLGTEWALNWAARSAELVRTHRVELIELDRAIGDGDHGENLDRGFSAVMSKLSNTACHNPGEVLKTIATTLLSTVGGASGPLLGTAFLRAAKSIGTADIDEGAMVAMLEAALGGIQTRGKASEGEKTMVDAWAPAARAARDALADGMDIAGIMEEAAMAAADGAEATIPMVATKGRASYLGERSAGHQDPGAKSSALILKAAAEAIA